MASPPSIKGSLARPSLPLAEALWALLKLKWREARQSQQVPGYQPTGPPSEQRSSCHRE